jgi:hypothetical protein
MTLLVATSNDIDGCRELAAEIGGELYIDERASWQHLPFRALLISAGDDPEPLRKIADRGLYVVERRVVKAGLPDIVGIFPLLHHPDKTHEETDAHWRDVHAPLALHHHQAMVHYSQLNVLECLSGDWVDGIALCGFATLDDFRTRFFSHADSEQIINADVANFADIKRSPRRLVATRIR